MSSAAQSPINSMQARLLTLPKRQQILFGVGMVALLVVPFIMTQSLIPLGIILATAIGYTVIRNPTWSIFAFVVINVVLTLRPKQSLAGDAPTALDLILGIALAGILCYWITRLRFSESQPLSTSIGQLCLCLFFVWTLFVTVLGFLYDQNPFFAALREILDLTPLLILPILYERYITPDSKTEKLLFAIILLAGIVVIVRGIFDIRTNLLNVAYLFQIGRTHLDATFPGFLALIATSLLMSSRNLKMSLILGALLLLACVGVVTTFSRNLYVATLVSLIIVLLSGTRVEFRRGSKRVLLTGATAVLCMVPVVLSNRLIRLLLLNYGLRFLSTPRSMTTDLSMLNRYAEYRDVWQTILRSPLFGYGFGARFRTFQIIDHIHVWASFTHNSYLYLAFKTGIPATLLFISAFLVFLYKGSKLIRSEKITNTARILVRASVAFLILFLIYAFNAPIFDSKTDMVWIGLIWGYFLALEQKLRNNNDAILLNKPTTESTIYN